MHVGSKNRGGVFPPKSSILIGFSIILTIHLGVPLFLETPIYRGGDITGMDNHLEVLMI